MERERQRDGERERDRRDEIYEWISGPVIERVLTSALVVLELRKA